jgi:hypothetical protein
MGELAKPNRHLVFSEFFGHGLCQKLRDSAFIGAFPGEGADYTE